MVGPLHERFDGKKNGSTVQRFKGSKEPNRYAIVPLCRFFPLCRCAFFALSYPSALRLLPSALVSFRPPPSAFRPVSPLRLPPFLRLSAVGCWQQGFPPPTAFRLLPSAISQAVGFPTVFRLNRLYKKSFELMYIYYIVTNEILQIRK